ncbi:MAG TPA: Crp/Fnr family transcriptional regulator [Acidobacteriaceae bacterium]|jgi:CRP/FNR family cyclic AMP-dependent transcriptional regulator|nr:Crp/Fnr family transcriptional regulator [Acidobacteriaceae bacterium]
MERNQGCLDCPVRGKHLFCNMEAAAIEKFDSIGTPVQFSRGAIIFREGDSCGSIHVLCSGRVKLSATSREGRTLILKIARAGEVLGLSAALANQPYEVTAETVEPVRLKTIRRQALLDFLDRTPDASMRAARTVALEYKAAFSEVRRLALPATASGRVAGLLLDWSRDAAPANAVQGRCMMPLTHEEIASMTATTRETVTRVLGQMKRDQLISIRGAALTVLQPQALEQLAV